MIVFFATALSLPFEELTFGAQNQFWGFFSTPDYYAPKIFIIVLTFYGWRCSL